MKKNSEPEHSEHPLWSYSGLSDEELKSILSDPDHDQFVPMAVRLLESSLKVDEVFEYIEPEIFSEHFDRIKKSFGRGEQSQKHRRFWKRMAEQGKKQLGIETTQPTRKPSKDVASETAERIGQRIRKLRREEGISQSELANRLNVSRQVISRLENGKHNPSFEKIKRVLNALGYKPNLQIVAIGRDD